MKPAFSLLFLCAAGALFAQRSPLAGTPASVSAGKRLYDETCQACHGGSGTGGRAPALSTGAFPHGGSDSEVFQSIRAGIQGTQMAGFPTLSSDEVWQLVSYIRSLSNSPAAAADAIVGDAAAG